MTALGIFVSKQNKNVFLSLAFLFQISNHSQLWPSWHYLYSVLLKCVLFLSPFMDGHSFQCAVSKKTTLSRMPQMLPFPFSLHCLEASFFQWPWYCAYSLSKICEITSFKSTVGSNLHPAFLSSVGWQWWSSRRRQLEIILKSTRAGF